MESKIFSHISQALQWPHSEEPCKLSKPSSKEIFSNTEVWERVWHVEKHHFWYAYWCTSFIIYLDQYQLFLTDLNKYIAQESTHSHITLYSHPHHCTIPASSPTRTTKPSLLFTSRRTIFSPFAQFVTWTQNHSFISSQRFIRYETRRIVCQQENGEKPAERTHTSFFTVHCYRRNPSSKWIRHIPSFGQER